MLKILILILLVIFILPTSAFACTSFALYGNQIFYGMNFDYFSIPLKFLIESRTGMNIFHLSFLYDRTVDDPEYQGYFAKTCGMNSKGLFCASQEIEPHIPGRKKTMGNEVHIDDQYDALHSCSTADQAIETTEGRQWIQYIGPSIHNMFADINGNAIVTETDNTENFATEMEGDFCVMSNFANHSLSGKSYKDAAGVGADRYITAYRYIKANSQSFSTGKGFDLLKQVALNAPDCTTLCSMIFKPASQDIFIALNQDVERIWRVSLENNTIETHRGFETHNLMPLDENGILASDLEGMS